MSTVKNYDAAGFTNSEIEIKSGQNYDINFKNAIKYLKSIIGLIPLDVNSNKP